jgi:hypothetical protein
MGNKVSKQQRKIHDFSFPFIDPNPKYEQDLKAIEEEKNKALLDKKRFAVRLSDVEELYAKKCDLAAELENTLCDLKLDKKKLQDDLTSIKVNYKICQIERTIALLAISRLQKENKSMRLLLQASASSQELNTISDTQLESAPIKSQCDIAAKQIINKLISELREKDLNLSRLLQKLEVIQDEKSKTAGNIVLSRRLEKDETDSQKIEKSFSVEGSIDSFGAEKSIFPL